MISNNNITPAQDCRLLVFANQLITRDIKKKKKSSYFLSPNNRGHHNFNGAKYTLPAKSYPIIPRKDVKTTTRIGFSLKSM